MRQLRILFVVLLVNWFLSASSDRSIILRIDEAKIQLLTSNVDSIGPDQECGTLTNPCDNIVTDDISDG